MNESFESFRWTCALEDEIINTHIWVPRCLPSPTNSSLQFYHHNTVDYGNKIEDGFYDPGRGRGPDLLPLGYLMTHPEPNAREIVVVDSQNDTALRWIRNKCITLLKDIDQPREKVAVLALLVSNYMGGSSSDLAQRSEKFIFSIRRRIGINAVPIGEVQHGVCRHRALLFKYLCDAAGIHCRLLRGEYKTPSRDESHAWNVVMVDDQHWLVDVMNDPGALYEEDSELTKRYHRHAKECAEAAVNIQGPGMSSLPIPNNVARDEVTQCHRMNYKKKDEQNDVRKELELYKIELKLKEEQIRRMAERILDLQRT